MLQNIFCNIYIYYIMKNIINEKEEPLKEAIKEAINIAGSNTVEIKKEIYKLPISGYDKIKLTAQKGNYIGVSVFRFKICNE